MTTVPMRSSSSTRRMVTTRRSLSSSVATCGRRRCLLRSCSVIWTTPRMLRKPPSSSFIVTRHDSNGRGRFRPGSLRSCGGSRTIVGLARVVARGCSIYGRELVRRRRLPIMHCSHDSTPMPLRERRAHSRRCSARASSWSQSGGLLSRRWRTCTELPSLRFVSTCFARAPRSATCSSAMRRSRGVIR